MSDEIPKEIGEQWAPIEGHEGCYSVSSYGRIFCHAFTEQVRGFKRNGRMLKSFICNHRQSVTLLRPVAVANTPVHRLVCKAFIANPNKLPEVRFCDNNRNNCRADNLRWASRPNALAAEVIEKIRAFEKRGMTARKASIKLGLGHSGMTATKYFLGPRVTPHARLSLRRTWKTLLQHRREAAMGPVELPPIPHEQETDITYLSWLPHFSSLDATPFEDGNSNHERIAADGLNPLEALIWSEEHEAEQAANDDRYSRAKMFSSWIEAKRPLQSLESAFLGVAM